ncbi:MAG: hypothetical protein HFACDABA_01855 [Anaerolineales bacterium]|nr:hypothetical protein [Anaerolineales bacterium]
MAFSNASYTNQRMTRINPRKFAKFAYSWHSRSKPAGLSSDFEKTIKHNKNILDAPNWSGYNPPISHERRLGL